MTYNTVPYFWKNIGTRFAQSNEEYLKIEKGAIIMQIDPVCGMQVDEAKTQKVILPVQGMSCASCVSRVQKALNQVPGVIHASVNFATEKATVVYSSGQATAEDLTTAIASAGYKVLEIDEELFVDIVMKQPWEKIAFIALYDTNGKILLHSSKRLIGKKTDDPFFIKMMTLSKDLNDAIGNGLTEDYVPIAKYFALKCS